MLLLGLSHKGELPGVHHGALLSESRVLLRQRPLGVRPIVSEALVLTRWLVLLRRHEQGNA